MKPFLPQALRRFCGLFLLAGSLTAAGQGSAGKHPNIVLILTDQWRAQALGFLGQEKVQTPHIDSFVRGGLALTQMVSNYPVCSPARAMLMTGNYPVKTKVYANVNSHSAPFGVELQQNMVCWSDVLKKKGYSNGYIGKWHLDAPHKPYVACANNTEKLAWNEWTPAEKRHGFDYWYAYGTYDYHNRPMYWDTRAPRDSFHFVDQWGPEHEADKALEFLANRHNERKAGAPFSLVVSINPPHSPYHMVPEKYVALYQNIPVDSLLDHPNIPPAGTPAGEEYRKNIKYYYACISGVDEQIGRIIRGLKEHGQLDNTIVLITADHGNCLGKHDELSKNNIYEESLRIPLIVYWKGKIQAGIDQTFLGNIPDIYPTLLELAGHKKDIPRDIEGKSYARYFLDRSGPVPAEQFIMGAILSSDPKVNSGFRGIRNTHYKLAYRKNGKKMERYLFDLRNDPFELNNLYRKDHEQVKALRPKLEEWLQRTKDGFVLNEE
ncbi:sulfatase [Paraflavisolibacter sp. H34]|uniref:sulfatase family protein n=1 Tax=Huijunlia imazamoxiresistens TaxID=3127457 RepID=UPI0030184ABA